MTESQINLLFGKGHLPVTIPAHVRPSVIRKGALPRIPEGPDVVPVFAGG